MRPPRRRDSWLNANQVWRLVSGYYYNAWLPPFASEAEERAAWQANRDVITALAKSRGRPMAAASRFDFEPVKAGPTALS
jgi:hypothetical protein